MNFTYASGPVPMNDRGRIACWMGSEEVSVRCNPARATGWDAGLNISNQSSSPFAAFGINSLTFNVIGLPSDTVTFPEPRVGWQRVQLWFMPGDDRPRLKSP